MILDPWLLFRIKSLLFPTMPRQSYRSHPLRTELGLISLSLRHERSAQPGMCVNQTVEVNAGQYIEMENIYRRITYTRLLGFANDLLSNHKTV